MLRKILVEGLIFRIWLHLNKRRKLQFLILFALILLSSVAEIISLGAVLPFLAAITSPESIFDNYFILGLRKIFDINSPQDLVLPVTLIFIAASLFAASIRVLLAWVGTKLSFGSGADLSIQAYKKTLYQPYKVHIERNSSEVVSGITAKVNSATSALYLAIGMLGSTIISLAIICALIYINPMIAFISSLTFGLSYLLISKFTSRRLFLNSRIINTGHSASQKILQEGLGGIRDILLNGTQSVYINKFTIEQRKLRGSQGNNNFIASSPRFVIEAIGISLIASLAFFLVSTSEGPQEFIPTLGAMALGAQRLIPSLQQIYSSYAGISGHQESLVAVLELLEQSSTDKRLENNHKAIKIEQDINLNSIYFRYSDSSPWILEDFNLCISKGQRIGIVGHTGSGKSTLIDILMGLLQPSRGEISVDGKIIHEDFISQWQSNIAHVPQAIFLADVSITENIAFGTPVELIDMSRVEEACRQSELIDFINTCPSGLNTLVGEQGIRLSGGQRQRIGIARALYKEADLLVFDEATSSLDNITEKSVIKSIENLKEDLTIITIAHRISTIKNKDSIIVLDNGRLSSQGTYEDLMEESSLFRKLVNSSKAN